MHVCTVTQCDILNAKNALVMSMYCVTEGAVLNLVILVDVPRIFAL